MPQTIKCHCQHCGYKWIPGQSFVAECPRCQQPKWSYKPETVDQAVQRDSEQPDVPSFALRSFTYG